MSFRLSLSRGSQKAHQSAAAKHAYQNRIGDYSSNRDGLRDDLLATGQGNMPTWAENATQFWDACDRFERSNASLFIELQLNLPNELAVDQWTLIINDFAEHLLTADGLPYSWAIHSGDAENPNPHVHLMLSERRTDQYVRTAETHFKRANRSNPEAGGALKATATKSREWLIKARGTWAEVVNTGLKSAGHVPRFDHRSLFEQACEAVIKGDLEAAALLLRQVPRHEGPKAHGQRKRIELGVANLDQVSLEVLALIEHNNQVLAFNEQWGELVPKIGLHGLAQALQPLAFVGPLPANQAVPTADFLREAVLSVAKQLAVTHAEALAINSQLDRHKLAIEWDSALIEDAQRSRKALREAVTSAQQALATVQLQIANHAPAVATEQRLLNEAREAQRIAQEWHKTHGLASWVRGLVRIDSESDRAAIAAIAAYRAAQGAVKQDRALSVALDEANNRLKAAIKADENADMVEFFAATEFPARKILSDSLAALEAITPYLARENRQKLENWQRSIKIALESEPDAIPMRAYRSAKVLADAERLIAIDEPARVRELCNEAAKELRFQMRVLDMNRRLPFEKREQFEAAIGDLRNIRSVEQALSALSDAQAKIELQQVSRPDENGPRHKPRGPGIR